MEKLNVMKTRELDLCTSCEICFAVCSVGAITMEYRLGQFFPTVDEKKCIKCGLCLKLCPGINIMPFIFEHKKVPNNIFDGNYLECYTAYSNDRKIRKNSTSGGLITDLVVGLVKNKEFDGAFVLDFDKLDGKSARLKCTNNIDEIFKSAKSKYIPASVYNIIKTLKERNNNSYIIIGTPCQIWGIKNFIKNLRLSEINLLFLGLFCERTLNFNLIQYFEDMYKKSNEKIVKFEFRTKEKYGWPGNSKLYFNSGRELIVSRNVRMQLKEFFQLNRCLFCVDKLNELADISFGDCYIEGKNDINGRSTVIIRTKKGKEIFDRYSYLFTFEKETIEEIRKSQHLIEKKDNLEYAKILAKKAGLYSNILPDYEIDGRAAKKLLKLQRRIKWGKHYNVHKIRFAFVCSNITKKLKNIERKILLGIASAVIIGEDFFLHWQRKRKNDRKKIAENIIIVGSDLANKGSQAMVFTVVNQIKRAFPNKKIYLFSSAIDFERNEKEKNIYKFNILPWDLKIRIWFLALGSRFFKKNSPYGYLKNRIQTVFENTDFIIDISGYALSSQWGLVGSINYLLNILAAKKYAISYYIFPQSIGPFNYSISSKIILYPLLSFYLKYPEKIFLREDEGVKSISKFAKNNIEKSYDIVLQSGRYNIDNIYKEVPHLKNIAIEPNSVGVVPNIRVIERTKTDEIYLVYKLLINKLIDIGKNVYILRHSYEDLEICENIKNIFSENQKVRLIADDLNAIELENIIKQCDFLIASRYHSIVHSYKNGVPCLVIGWATKYFDLLKNFDQLDYFFDGRNTIDLHKINNKLDKMIQCYKYEKEKIIERMNIINNKENIFNEVFEHMKKTN